MEAEPPLDDRCYLYVFGPGFGESIVLRFPGGHWMVVDGCMIAGQSPAASLLEREGAQWSCVALTHPHLDHALGLDEVLGQPGGGPVGCADHHLPSPESWINSPDAEHHLRSGGLEAVMAAIHDNWTSNPDTKWLLRRGDERDIGPARVRVLHPDEDAAQAGASSGQMNRLSAAMLVTWEGMKVILGADVEGSDWQAIGQWLGGLGAHACLKVPHHGASSGICECWLAGDPQRLWIVTPFNKGSKLPDFSDGGGLARLLDRASPVHLTGLPVAADMQGQVPCRTSRRAIRDGQEVVPLPAWVDGSLRAERLPEAEESMACHVMAQLGHDGRVLDLEYGPGAVVVDR